MANNKPNILNIAPDEGLIETEMVPEGDFTEYEMTIEHLVSNLGMPASMMEEALNMIKTDPKFRESLDGKIAVAKDHMKNNPDKYGHMDDEAFINKGLGNSIAAKGDKGGY